MVRRGPVVRVVIAITIALLFFSSIVSAVSFLAGPSVVPGNATTQSALSCQFTPNGTGTLIANITWWYYNTSWNNHVDDNQSIGVTSGVSMTSNSVSAPYTAKGQSWRCQVTLYNESSSFIVNSSSNVIQNSAPIITNPLIDQIVYEDTPFNLVATATDPDNDPIMTWISSDLNASEYGGVDLFTIASNGEIVFTVHNDSLAGNHTILIMARDNNNPLPGWGTVEIIFEVIAVNDAPDVPSNQNFSCQENSLCEFTFLASDEESSSLFYDPNVSFINMDNETGTVSFTPVFDDVGDHVIQVNVSDGEMYTLETFNLSIITINHLPVFTYNSSLLSSGVQNQSERFIFYVNATDIDSDILSFSVETSCGKNPWNMTTLFNGSGGVNATGMINSSFVGTSGFIPNDFVECKEITVIVDDGKTNTSANFSLNITNSNDPPVIHNMSYYPMNGLQNNLSNISSAKGLDFIFKVNASDIDTLTYEGESWSFALYGHNVSKFQINPSTGVITSVITMTDAYVGNHSFLVVVTDDGGLVVNETVNITIINNAPPVIRSLDNSSCTEDVVCLKALIADDAELNIINISEFTLSYTPPSLVNGLLVYNVSNRIIYDDAETKSLFINYVNLNSSSIEYLFNVTANDSQVGLYELNMTFGDEFGLNVSDTLTFNITNVNDMPFLDNDNSKVAADPIILFPAVRDKVFQKVIYAVDDDLFYGLNNLTFNYSLESGSNITANFNLTKISANSALLSFYPNSTHVGVHKINFSVSDGEGGSDLQEINFTVYHPSSPPNITQIRPYSLGVNNTIDGLGSEDLYPSPTAVYAEENDSLIFEVVVIDVDSSLDNVTLTWFFDGTQVQSEIYNTNRSFKNYFDYFSNGTYSVLVNVSDELLSYTTHEWIITVFDNNQPPMYLNPLGNLSAAENSSISGPQTFIDFFRLTSNTNIVFIDPDDDLNNDLFLGVGETNTLTFSVNESGGCAGYADFTFSGADLSIKPNVVGTCYTNFIASDSSGENVSSNTIKIDILELDSGQTANPTTRTITVTERITVPIQEDVDVPEEFQLVIPGITTIYANGTVVIPIRLKNSWTEPLYGISLKANASVDGLISSFSKNTVPLLAVDAEEIVNLTFHNYRLDAPFEVNISAYIDSLDYTDTTAIYVNALEKSGEDSDAVKSKIGFARDLLSDNPECQELNELLDEAERNPGAEDDSLELIDQVIRSCKYLINTNSQAKATGPESFLGKVGLYTDALIDMRTLLTVVLALTIGALVIGFLTKIRLKKI